ncbi:MAG: hypothetical protein H7836_02695 [Magnetococcus sp. YQC-3]
MGKTAEFSTFSRFLPRRRAGNPIEVYSGHYLYEQWGWLIPVCAEGEGVAMPVGFDYSADGARSGCPEGGMDRVSVGVRWRNR